jgi:hypothetical protein
MANGDDIGHYNETLPRWPKRIKLRHKIMCLLGYHLPETRKTGGTHKYPGMKLRQCGRCDTLL